MLPRQGKGVPASPDRKWEGGGTGSRGTFEFPSRVNLSGPSFYCIARTNIYIYIYYVGLNIYIYVGLYIHVYIHIGLLYVIYVGLYEAESQKNRKLTSTKFTLYIVKKNKIFICLLHFRIQSNFY